MLLLRLVGVSLRPVFDGRWKDPVLDGRLSRHGRGSAGPRVASAGGPESRDARQPSKYASSWGRHVSPAIQDVTRELDASLGAPRFRVNRPLVDPIAHGVSCRRSHTIADDLIDRSGRGGRPFLIQRLTVL
ncbi:hypothetical protein VFPBJ_03827 [Purpureocillium lilacinum]|uniref:Uncharacterized protein n=1 Tax=Purpureocillium lilacinum TaxID=33203 RepID=A0A179H4E8_PURLI|nr:hypothetical protein VFPBJ_03827 [Purpureocillium lilacinum]